MKLQTLFLRFLGVGACGFIIDAAVFQLLFLAGGGLIISRLISATVAITGTWYLNRRLVFQTHQLSAMGSEYRRYFSVQLVGFLINFIFYLAALALVPALRTVPIIAIALGSAAALLVNFAGARWWAFRTRQKS